MARADGSIDEREILVNTFARFLVGRLRNKFEEDPYHFPIQAEAGPYYSTLTGGGPPTVEIDWPKLQADIEALEVEFSAKQEQKGK